MRLDPRIRTIVAKADKLIAESGCRAVCIACFQRKQTDRPPDEQGGCCQGCEESKPSGCNPKPVSCAVWLCSYAQRKFPKLTKQLAALQKEAGILASPYGDYWRMKSIYHEARLVQIQGAK